MTNAPPIWRRSAAPPLFSAVLALLIRGAVLASLWGTPLTRVMVGDSRTYREIARLLIEGRLSEVGVFFQTPLYPFFLAVLERMFGPGWAAVALVQALLGSLACAAISQLAAWSFPGLRGAPWIAGAGAALCGPLVFFDMEVLPASLAASLLIFGIFLLGKRDAGRWRHLAAGLLMGCASLLAPALLLVVLLASVWRGLGIGAPGRTMPLRGALLLVGAAAVIAPVTAHNWAAGDAVLISSNGGVNAFIGNSAQATGAFTLPPGAGLDGTRLAESAREAAEHQEGRSLSPGQVSKHWFRRALRYPLDEPLAWARLLVRKGLLTINHYEIPNHLNFQFVTARFAGLLGALLPFWLVFPLAGLGAVVAWSRGGGGARLLVMAGATCLGVPVLFFVTARYRVPALPFLLVLGGGGAAWLVAQVQGRAWRRAVAGAGLTILLLLPTRLHLMREGDFGFDHLVLGEVHRQLGNLDEAVLELKLARETGPPTSDASYRLATVLEERGNLGEAAESLRSHLRRHPDDLEAAERLTRLEDVAPTIPAPPAPRTDFEIGLDLQRQGDLAGAARAFRLAVRKDPAHGWAWSGLGGALNGQGFGGQALQALRKAVALEPGSAVLWSNLGVVLYQEERWSEAKAAAERSLQIDPGHAESRLILERLAARDRGSI